MKTFVCSILVLSIAAPALAQRARPQISEATAAHMREYSAKAKETLFQGKGTQGRAAEALQIFDSSISKHLELRADQNASIRSALTVDPQNPASAARVERALDALVSIAAARNLAKKLAERPGMEAEVKALNESVNDLVANIESSVHTRSTDTSRLTPEQKAEHENLSLAVENLERQTSQILTMKSEPQEIFMKVISTRKELLATGKFSGEEALVQSIMKVRGVDRAEALKIAEKLRTCK